MLCERVGIDRFITLDPVFTFRRLTLELLSTLEVNEREDEEDNSKFDVITFQLMNRPLEFDYGDINIMFGWDDDAPTYGMLDGDSDGEFDHLSDVDFQEVWRSFTLDNIFEARRAKSSRIIHPAARYVHRLLVYSVWGRHELGAMSVFDMKALWLMTKQCDLAKPFPINYGEQFIRRMIDFRDGKLQKRDIVMGGMVTIIASQKVSGFDIQDVDIVSPDNLLNERMLVTTIRWLGYAGGSTDRFTWFVGREDGSQAPWMDLPDPESTRLRDCTRESPFKLDNRYTQAVSEGQAAPRARPSRQHTTTTGASSSSGGPTLESVVDEMRQMRLDMETYQRRQMAEADYTMTYVRGLYAAQVEAMNIRDPYLNFPHHPPQHGPIPGWHGGRPTYPYYPPRPEGIDYRFPGGSDPTYDLNSPPFDSYPIYPPGYFDSVPPMEQTWGSVLMPPWANYENHPGSSSHKDEDQ